MSKLRNTNSRLFISLPYQNKLFYASGRMLFFMYSKELQGLAAISVNDFLGFFIYNNSSINGGRVHETNRTFNRGSCFTERLRDQNRTAHVFWNFLFEARKL